ncbi:MAG: DUF805 domain-containing protein [Muribaculaceae bacterium]|nr:DUF805 domain-containing protein [Muribaculaceae bacterium]
MYQRQVSFKEAVERAILQNYCNFSGRASRSEYWWYVLFTAILGFVITVVFCWSENAVSIVSGIVNLALLLPGLGLCVRRLHDIGKSGWWIFLALIPLIGAIILIVWYCKDSQMQPNEYGPVPNMVG